jgi:hypothetical protein
MLQAALEAEIEEHLSRLKRLVDEDGKRLVVRNGVSHARAKGPHRRRPDSLHASMR